MLFNDRKDLVLFEPVLVILNSAHLNVYLYQSETSILKTNFYHSIQDIVLIYTEFLVEET